METVLGHSLILDLIQSTDIRQRLILVHAVNRGCDRLLECQRRHIRTDAERHEIRGSLFVRDVNTSAAFISNAVHSLVMNHPNYLPRNVRAELGFSGNDFLDQDALADGILVRKLALGKAFIDHEDWRRTLRVVIRKSAPPEQLKPQGSEVRWTHDFEESARTIGAIRQRMIGDLHRHSITRALQR